VTFSHDTAGTSAEEWAADPRTSGLRPWALDEDLDRVVVVAAHPDDESLGAGGLMAAAHRAGIEVALVCATRGEGSHPASITHSPSRLASLRQAELRDAVDAVAPGAVVHELGLPDGQVNDHESDVLTAVVGVVGDGRRTLVVAPWRHDGHPDHEAVGRAAAAAAVRTGATRNRRERGERERGEREHGEEVRGTTDSMPVPVSSVHTRKPSRTVSATTTRSRRSR